MTIIDSHCHAWAYWPYEPPVPDPESRGVVAQLLHEMDQNSVNQALIVCAEIDHNPENNAYVAQYVRDNPRLHMVADVDSQWKPTYHQPGAAERLRAAIDQFPLAGFTHYLKNDDAGEWLYSEDGLAFFQVAADNGLIASISCGPQHQSAIQQVAHRFPQMPILIHHMGHIQVNRPEDLKAVIASAAYPNIYVKVSGFYYGTAQPKWDYPLADMQPIVKALYEHFGPQRLCWGSDYPVVRHFMTYQHALEKFRTHCDFIPADDQAWILGGTLERLLTQ